MASSRVLAAPPVPPPFGDDDLCRAQEECAELRATIVAMREAMTRMQFEGEQRCQQAVADGQREVADLRATVAALRDEMERQAAQARAARAEMEVRYQEEIREHQEAIRTLRLRLEAHDAASC